MGKDEVVEVFINKPVLVPDEVTKTPATETSARLHRARDKGNTLGTRDQLISRKTTPTWRGEAFRVPAPSVNPESVNKTKTVGGSSGLYKNPRSVVERHFGLIRTKRNENNLQILPSASTHVRQGDPSKHFEAIEEDILEALNEVAQSTKSREEEQNSSNQEHHDLIAQSKCYTVITELASCMLFRRTFLKIMLFRKKILKIIRSDRYNRLGKEEFEQSCMDSNTILYKPIRDGLTLENLTKVRKYPEAFQDGAPVAHLTRPHASNQVLTSNYTEVVYKNFRVEQFSIEQDDSHPGLTLKIGKVTSEIYSSLLPVSHPHPDLILGGVD